MGIAPFIVVKTTGVLDFVWKTVSGSEANVLLVGIHVDLFFIDI